MIFFRSTHIKLSTALAKLKKLKSQIARTNKYVEESVVHFEGEEPPYEYEAEIECRRKLLSELRSLKARITATNVVTKVNFSDNAPAVSLNELILLNAELRSEMAYWTEMLKQRVDPPFGGRTTNDIKKVFAKGFNKAEIKAKLNQLEKSKEQVEQVLNKANAETDLVG
jgi:hypothetical protein